MKLIFLTICTLSLGLASQSIKLHEVKRIYVGEMRKSDEAEGFRLLLEEQLAKREFLVVDAPEQADATLVGILTVRTREEDSSAQATVYLKTKEGVVDGKWKCMKRNSIV